ncbi:MAG: hypothetical protein UY23_C0001G0184 [Candidatus Jorgensenbacteria bacterium GW2011_GWA1_48_11]|uniref:PrgI family protein n=1 Tax=Candidatus Jorgensenbacteria bacterium GW2011_GWA1_48_11 TaxID=1618660 RepID=A0A0G1WMM4_9BACT|nr:MAG: hypothetical protein UY23_C0001G0184 [Candidatus Jorgensenbacteria bacterium GW2011_GWA1_48_11]KKW12071.1 MAG: hypothetical protein UY51_C0005G0313 [Candidatus Jorgensenbacteria bacterium GW2011_GWB1_49_9]
MPNFQVPQFIEQKAKIVGPFTLTQFLYIAAAVGLGFVAYYVFSFFLWFVITLVAVSAAIALAFVKINGQELPQILRASLNYFLKPRTYTWQRSFAQKTLEVGDLEQIEGIRKGMGLEEKIKSVALSIATGKIFSAKDQGLENKKQEYQAVTFLTGEKRLAKRVDFAAEEKPKKKK